MVERVLDSPEFEKRASVFIDELNALQEKDEGFKWHCVSYYLAKAFPGLISGLDRLQSLISGSEIDLPVLPGEMADDLDIESANLCVVEFSAIMDAKRPLEEFIEKALRLAEKYKAEIDTSMHFGTEGKTNFIDTRHDEANGWLHHTRIYFRFG